MKTLTEFRYPASLVEQVTGATLSAQRSWQSRGFLRMPEEPKAGKARVYPLLGLYECALYASASDTNIPIWLVADAFRQRIEGLGAQALSTKARNGVFAAFQGELWKAGGDSGKLQEFSSNDADETYYWVIRATGYSETDRITEFTVVRSADVADVLASTSSEAQMLVFLDVSSIVRRVDKALAAEGHPVESDK